MAGIPSTTGFLDVQGAPLYYEVAGQGPALLLIRAGVGDLWMWDQQFETFARHYQTIRFDMRSFGKSLVPDQPFANHEDPVALLQHLGIRKAHIIGASFLPARAKKCKNREENVRKVDEHLWSNEE